MEAKELRLGNYVEFHHVTKGVIKNFSKVGSLSIGIDKTRFSIGVEDYHFTADYKGIKPIPLTEEWLLKFGFIKECDWKISIGEGAFIWIDENDFTVAIGIPYEASGNQRTMKHVHQLQNLYHALTGEELTIKE